MHAILIAAKPAAIPTKLEVDVTALDIGNALHVSDLKLAAGVRALDRKSTRLNSSHLGISYAVFCLKKKKNNKVIPIATRNDYPYCPLKTIATPSHLPSI